MGRSTFTRSAYAASHAQFVPTSGPSTRAGSEQVRNTGRLHPLVDPAEYGVIRRSLVRFDQLPSGLLELTVGCSMPIETRLDTTGSMGRNVEIALAALVDLYEQCSGVLPGFDVHMAIGIFGDCADEFVLCRPQFEMIAEKIVEQLTYMNPEHGGAGNGGEDPHYGIFGGAYLVAAYANRIGLKRYDFTISDEPARYDLSENQLVRIFGQEVFDKTAANGFNIDRNDLPSTKEVVEDLFKQAHAFFLEVPSSGRTHDFWTHVYGPERVVVLPEVRLLPQIQAIIIGLTEGTLALDQVPDFLSEAHVHKDVAAQVQRSVANIPIGAQVPLREAIRVPQKGDIFLEKPDVFAGTNLWPLDPDTANALQQVPTDIDTNAEADAGPSWL